MFGSRINNDFGQCSNCEELLQGSFETIKETVFINGNWIKTGKDKRICDFVYCPNCGKNFAVDGSFDYYI